jgi:hypothetical protein
MFGLFDFIGSNEPSRREIRAGSSLVLSPARIAGFPIPFYEA